MTASDDNILKTLVSRSGYPFQIAVEHEIRRTQSAHGWRVVGTEYAWENNEQKGYADIVIQNGNMRTVIECKRVSGPDDQHVFLVPRPEPAKTERFRYYWRKQLHPHGPEGGWHDVFLEPTSVESSFCAVGKNRPPLEKIAADTVAATEAIADELVEQSADDATELSTLCLGCPMIVTNGPLIAGCFDPTRVKLETGEIEAAAYRAVPFVRFRKALAVGSLSEFVPADLEAIHRTRERSVLVVRATALVDVLAGWNVLPLRGGHRHPWV